MKLNPIGKANSDGINDMLYYMCFHFIHISVNADRRISFVRFAAAAMRRRIPIKKKMMQYIPYCGSRNKA
jgi:hypothetical protein